MKVISENIKEIRCKGPDFVWYFYLSCSYCNQEHSNEIYFTLNDEVEMQKGHATANFIMSCKNCKKTMSVSAYNKSAYSINCENDSQEEVFATFECRGCIILKWSMREGFKVESKESDKVFEDVNLNDVWCDYDETAGVNCSILEPVSYRIEKNKNIK